ncbi:MAG TPA: methyl-accepting chemotaxis protein [Burkholderiaceae bacterium]|nr:methyl-accepting chemotaxis protein [Burkholderiaceae bacterium]
MSLLDQLSLSRKFVILGLIALLMIAVPTAIHVTKSFEEVRVAKLEAQGMPPLMALQKVIQFAQQHRGLSSGVLSGNAAMKDRRLVVKASVDKAVAEMNAQLDQAGASAALKSQWSQRQERWQALEQGVSGGQLTAADSTRQHTQFITTLLRLNADIMDEYGLTTDPSADTYNLIMASFASGPWLTEKLGIMRAMGTGFLTRANLPPTDKGVLTSLKDRVNELKEDMTTTIGHATAHNPAFAATLKAPADALRVQVEATLAMADKNLINATELTFAPAEYFDHYTRTIDVVYQFNATAMSTLQASLADRVKSLYTGIVLILALQLAGTLAAVGMAWVFTSSITQPIAQAVGVATAISQGDLTVSVPRRGTNETGQLLAALGAMQSHLNQLVSVVRTDAQGVATASQQIAQGNTDLSARTEQAAAALEQTAASMEQLQSHVQQNAEHARDADQLAHQARDVAVKGGEVVAEVVQTMRDIHTSSSKISDIIGVIDGIAFQTNILALNAAVEAARAGEAGRGFAVVASEVRSLAGRSAEAAKEIKGLISASVSRVDAGTALVDQAGQTMDEVVSAIKRVTDLMADISSASTAQSTSVAEVGQAISLMDQATQHNASLVEESAAAAASLRQQAQQLVEAAQVFKTT